MCCLIHFNHFHLLLISLVTGQRSSEPAQPCETPVSSHSSAFIVLFSLVQASIIMIKHKRPYPCIFFLYSRNSDSSASSVSLSHRALS